MLKTSRMVAKTTNETDFNDASLHPGRNLGAEMGLRHQGGSRQGENRENRFDSLIIVMIVKVAIVAIQQNRCKVFVKTNGKCLLPVTPTEFSLHGGTVPHLSGTEDRLE